MRLRLEVLNVLAHSPDGRATLDQIARDAGAFAPSPIQTEHLKLLPEIADIDIFASGLVFRNNGWLHITDAGRSLLQSLGGGSFPTDSPTFPGAAFPERDSLDTEAMTDPGVSDRIGSSVIGERHSSAEDRPDEIRSSVAADQDYSVFVAAPDLRSIRQDSGRRPFRQTRFFAVLKAWTTTVADAWKRHREQNNAGLIRKRTAGRMGGAVSAFLSFFAFVACAAAVIALGQTKALKTDIARLNREVGSLSERLEKLERAEKARQETAQREAGQNKPAADPAADTGKAGIEARTDQAALNLSRDEIQIIREYVKPAPASGAPTPAINVGDPISGGTIPLPSSLTEKVPKLLGARFATRNGSIIIVRKDSRQVDAVLPAY
ncbi:hypothetical protein JQ615_36295 [Bradyrhizobium jicamae]|uniref:Uncharacterized protein n=1 Tax=Bradyrhizobium jicamae TaxID=280332 RepID=A0ABS5FVL8_9BRAD|nr:hypothetical protein [Bradyrhizobium jicamae]MBR0800837.1 hypothetical protein [Bradyrhizobium jicamae]